MDVANTSDRVSVVQAPASAEVEVQPDPGTSRSQLSTKQDKPAHWLVGAVSAVALPTVLVSMFGYGVTMGVTLSFNLDHGSLINGPFDLLTLIWPGAIMLMTMLGKGDLWQIFLEAVSNSFWVGVWLGVTTLCGIYLFKVMRHKQRGERFAVWVKGNFNRDMSFRKAVSVSAAVSVFTILVVPLMHLVGALLIVAGFVAAMTTPILGYMSGRAYVEEMIYKPQRCADTPTYEERLRARANQLKEPSSKSDKKNDDSVAACIAITSVDPSKAYLKAGRQVVANASDVLLWDPATGQGEIIPREGMSLTSINQKTYESLIPHVTGLLPQKSPDTKPSDAQSEK